MTDKGPKKAGIASPDIRVERLAELRRILPDLFDGDGRLDERALRQLVQPSPAVEMERLHFEWAEKKSYLEAALAPCRATLVADEGRSVDFDHTRNLIIEGDNLEVLKLLRPSYSERIKCIYIDPPYNTGKDFIYRDNHTESKEAYWQKNGVMRDGVKLTALTESDGRRHSRWLNMMHARLFAARGLLRQDGVIVVHIDEHEHHRLRILLEMVFGNGNFLGEVVWDKRNPKGDSRRVSYRHEAILIFAKNVEVFEESGSIEVPKYNAPAMLKRAARHYSQVDKQVTPRAIAAALKTLGIEDKGEYAEKYTLEDANNEYQEWIVRQNSKLSAGEAAYNLIDNSGRVYQSVSMAWPNDKKAPKEYRAPLIHPETGKPCPVPDKGWRNPPEVMEELIEAGHIVFGPDETVQPRRKYYLDENPSENLPSLLYYGGSDGGRLKCLGIPFDNPKPVEVAKRLITGFLDDGDIMLDFFAGSGTAAHAVLELNVECNKGFRFILVQMPERIDKKHAAFKAGYKTISNLCIDRVKKAGEAIQSANGAIGIDTGFRVYRLAGSLFPENHYHYDPAMSEDENMAALEAHLKAAKRPELFDSKGKDTAGLIAELSLKNGYGLFFTLSEIDDSFAGNTVYRLRGNNREILLCLDSTLRKETVNTLVEQCSDQQLILSDAALNSSNRRVLQRAFGDNLMVI